MKKIKLLTTVCLTGAFLVTSGATAFAEGTGTQADPAQGTGQIIFEENDDATGPVNPTDPSQPGGTDEPGDNNEVTGAKGPLSLDVYPSTFDFNTNKVDMAAKTYTSTLTGNHYLQVTDNRDDANGWSVKVYRTEFTNADSYVLTNSTLTLPVGVARNALNTPDASQEDTNLKHADALNIPVGADSAVQIFGAPATENVGKSTSTYVWDAAGETLTIPANTAKKGTYTSTINWVLTTEAYN